MFGGGGGGNTSLVNLLKTSQLISDYVWTFNRVFQEKTRKFMYHVPNQPSTNKLDEVFP